MQGEVDPDWLEATFKRHFEALCEESQKEMLSELLLLMMRKEMVELVLEQLKEVMGKK